MRVLVDQIYRRALFKWCLQRERNALVFYTCAVKPLLLYILPVRAFFHGSSEIQTRGRFVLKTWVQGLIYTFFFPFPHLLFGNLEESEPLGVSSGLKCRNIKGSGGGGCCQLWFHMHFSSNQLGFCLQ